MSFAGPVSESVVKVNPVTGTLTLEVCPQTRTQRLIEPVCELKAAFLTTQFTFYGNHKLCNRIILTEYSTSIKQIAVSDGLDLILTRIQGHICVKC